MNNPKFELFKKPNEQYYFHLKAGNGEITLSSEGYTSKQSCKEGIESVKKNSPFDQRYERKQNNTSFTFNLRAAGNDKVIGRSESYPSATARDKGIESVKNDAPGAPTNDLT